MSRLWHRLPAAERQAAAGKRVLDVYETWAPTNEMNAQRLQEHRKATEHPVCVVPSETQGQPPKGPDKEVGQIPRTFLGAVGSPTVLTKNQCVFFKLNNGARGTIVAFLFKPGEQPPQHFPVAAVVSFPAYDGPAFFRGAGREKWVPVPVNRSFSKDESGATGQRAGNAALDEEYRSVHSD